MEYREYSEDFLLLIVHSISIHSEGQNRSQSITSGTDRRVSKFDQWAAVVSIISIFVAILAVSCSV
jgi:hypothetical protein